MAGRPRRPGRAPAERALGRPAAARRARPRAGARAGGAAVRRAAVQPRRAPAPLDARGDPRLQQRLGLTVAYVTHDQERGAGGERPASSSWTTARSRRPARRDELYERPRERVRRRLHGRGDAVRRASRCRRRGAARAAAGARRAAPARRRAGAEGRGPARGLAASSPRATASCAATVPRRPTSAAPASTPSRPRSARSSSPRPMRGERLQAGDAGQPRLGAHGRSLLAD